MPRMSRQYCPDRCPTPLRDMHDAQFDLAAGRATQDSAGRARGYYGVIAGATLVGMLLNVLGINPIVALVYTTITNGVVTVPLLVLILLVVNTRHSMGAYTNGRLSHVVNILTMAFMGIAAVVTMASLFGH
jgi:Mn2+/Fe2+ NRAMP family transporter